MIMARLNKKIIFPLIYFFDENGLVFHVHISKQKFDDHIDLLLINDENKSHYVYIKDFNRYV